MSTTTAGTATLTASSEQNDAIGSVSSDKTTYRRYVKFGTDENGKTTIKETRILAETAKKASEKLKNGEVNPFAGLSTNWADAEEEGFTLLSENEVVVYNVKSFAGAAILSPDETIRLYIYNVGLASIQTARANALMKATKENTAEPEAEFNQVVIDLRVGVNDDGDYSLNKAPSRRTVDPLDKLIKQMSVMGISPEKISQMLAVMAQATESDETEQEVGAEA